MKYRYNFKIRFGDTDAYGIVHHRNYYNYFEEARFQFSADIFGFNVESDVKFPVIESSCIYKILLNFLWIIIFWRWSAESLKMLSWNLIISLKIKLQKEICLW